MFNYWKQMLFFLASPLSVLVFAQQPDPYNCLPETVIEIPDKQEFYPLLLSIFGKFVQGKPFNEQPPITCGDMQSLTSITFVGATTSPTYDLTGIEYAINLEEVSFAHAGAVSLEPLLSLKHLKSFIDESYRGIPVPHGHGACEEGYWKNDGSPLDFFTSIPQLETLELQERGITDLSPLTVLANLKNLTLACNVISDITPLRTLTKLESLDLSSNRITDLGPLSNLTNLTTLKLGHNCPESLEPLRNLKKLQVLEIAGDAFDPITHTGCPLADFRVLSEFHDLEQLVIADTNLSDLSFLNSLAKLKSLKLPRNTITDLAPFAEVLQKDYLPQYELDGTLTTVLDLSENNLSDLQPLVDVLENLDSRVYSLDLSYNCLDFSPGYEDVLIRQWLDRSFEGWSEPISEEAIDVQAIRRLEAAGLYIYYGDSKNGYRKPKCFMRTVPDPVVILRFYIPRN
jgi:Leucine-rich repeat (LRR) protein